MSKPVTPRPVPAEERKIYPFYTSHLVRLLTFMRERHVSSAMLRLDTGRLQYLTQLTAMVALLLSKGEEIVKLDRSQVWRIGRLFQLVHEYVSPYPYLTPLVETHDFFSYFGFSQFSDLEYQRNPKPTEDTPHVA